LGTSSAISRHMRRIGLTRAGIVFPIAAALERVGAPVENICQTLGLDPSFIRKGLRSWCIARRGERSLSRTVLHFPFRRVCGARHAMAVMS
jgi:hypothetical protein